MLEKIKVIMGIKSRKIVDSRNESILSVASDIIVNDLKEYGVVNKKTFKTYLPTINKRLEPHLIRGIFDGDGTVYIRENKYLTFGFYGNHTIVNDIKILLEKELDLADNTIFDKETVSSIYYGSRKDTKKFYSYIYNDSNIFLKRKKKKFETILNPS